MKLLRTTQDAASAQLAVDWTACRGRGLCAELLPERIGVDDWGYPVLSAAPVGEHLADAAEEAVALCPTLALRLRPVLRS